MQSDYYQAAAGHSLQKEYSASRRSIRDMYDIFNALRYTPITTTVQARSFIGQDPYHGPGTGARASAFRCRTGVPKPPPSLQNIFKELHDDLGCEIPSHGELTDWTRQGVMLMNTVLTVRRGQPNSHKGLGRILVPTMSLSCSMPERSRSIPAVGRERGRQGGAADRAAASCSAGGTPQPLFGAQRIFRLPAFFGRQPFSR